MSLFKSNLLSEGSVALSKAPHYNSFESIDHLEERLWKRSRIENYGKYVISKFACLVGFDASDLTSTKKLLRDAGVRRIAVFSDIPQLYEVIDRPKYLTNEDELLSHIFVNLDSFDCLDTGVDILLDLRKICKSVRIVLTSSHVSGDDFGGERNSICDATLSFPLGATSLRMAIRD